MLAFKLTKPVTKSKDFVIKNNILRRLSETVKEIQLCSMEENLSGDIKDIIEAGNNLCTVIESIFLHELRDSFVHKVKRAMADVDEMPEPNFWMHLQIISHKETIDQINNLSQISTEIGKCRAWIRITINECLLSSYIMTVRYQTNALKAFYNKNAFLRDCEMMDIAEKLISGIEECCTFNLPFNSSLLTRWSMCSLELAGVWSPTLKPYPIVSGVDVAGNLDATSSINSETCSLGSVVSLHSHNSALGQMINEEEALKIILAKSSTDNNLSSSNPPTEERSSEMSDTEGKSTDSESTNPLQITLGNSLNKRSGWSFGEKDNGCINRNDVNVENHNVEINKTMEHSYNALIESYNMLGSKTIRTPVLSDLMDKLENINKDSDEEKIDNFVMTTASQNVIESEESLANYVGKIANEKGLDTQNYECSFCKERLGVERKSKFCAYTGDYSCDDCLATEAMPIPSRIVHNWDFKKYVVSQRAYDYIQETKDHPVIDFKILNPHIYRVSEEMAKLQILRTQLNLLRAYLYTCREPVIEELQNLMYPQEYMYDHIHQYSINDLYQVQDGLLIQKLQKVVNFAKDHVTNCWLCSQKGFLCEICKKSKALFPFDVEHVYRCEICNAVYHNTCLNANKPCPKCERRKKRKA